MILMLEKQAMKAVNLIGRDIDRLGLDSDIEEFVCMVLSLGIRYVRH